MGKVAVHVDTECLMAFNGNRHSFSQSIDGRVRKSQFALQVITLPSQRPKQYRCDKLFRSFFSLRLKATELIMEEV